MTATIEVRGLTAGYAGSPVIEDLDLEVHEGEVVALLGPNGAGKTTTLLAISGILPPLDGEVHVLGERVSAGQPHRTARRGLAHVPEDRALFYSLTVRENIRLGQRPGGPDLDRLLGYFPALKDLIARRAGLLSGGEQQMLALARALASGPKVLMIDEMSLGLAPVIVENLLPVVRQIASEENVSVLLVEQHVHLALEVADRGYVLGQGQIILEGSAAELLESRELLEAGYLGELGQ
jgi:branched-chain amino acid transport system ATP-binding protein